MKKICRPNKKAVERFRKKWTDFYGNHCAYCTIDCKEESTIDHLTPLSKGGGNTLDNLVIACKTCNHEKGNLNVCEFKPLILQPLRRNYEMDAD